MNKAEKINFCISNISLLETPVSQSQIKSANVADLDKWVEEINSKLSSEEDNEEIEETGVSNEGLEVQSLSITTEMGKTIQVKVVMLKFIKFSSTGNLLFDYNGKTLTCKTRLPILNMVEFELAHKGSLFPIKLDTIQAVKAQGYGNVVSAQILEVACEQFNELREEARISSLKLAERQQKLKKEGETKTKEERKLMGAYNTIVNAKQGLENLGLDVDPALLAMIINK